MDRIIFHIDVNSAYLSWSAIDLLQANPDSVDIRTIPAIIGRKGIEKIVKIDLSKEEAEKFAASADAVRKTNNVLHEIKAI